MENNNTLSINGRDVAIDGAANLLELVRKAKIDLPTFCYHSELSVYGACRLCIVDVEGRGVVAACSTPPEPGMKVRTHTEEIREMRRVTVELLLASHQKACPTCSKSAKCKLLDISRRLGVDTIRFRDDEELAPLDTTSPALVRDPNKCVLCGDCVRYCAEVQGIGAIDFAHRGAKVMVAPAFGKDLADVECVNCGQCAAVCPTGAITPKNDLPDVWKHLDDPEQTVVVQVAPAVRVALGEEFGLPTGTIATEKMVAALKALGFSQVYDTSLAADLTVVEEAGEFLERQKKGEKLPQFTSCCPAWVKFAEQFYPDLLPNLSSCRSPQQMFGAVAHEILPERLGVKPENLTVVSVMPCTAKKFEARREEFNRGRADVDTVLTTQELAAMIRYAGIRFDELEPESFDLPLGFKTGAGVIFGNSGGVTEAVVRYAYEKVTGAPLTKTDVNEVRGAAGLRVVEIPLGDVRLKTAVVHGLKNARIVAEQIRSGECDYDLIEVMACPGGCIGGAGQPVNFEPGVRGCRTEALYNVDKRLQLHKAQDNPVIEELYRTRLGEPGGAAAHKLLHTTYRNRKRIDAQELAVSEESAEEKKSVSVCLGTSCFLRGSQDLLNQLMNRLRDEGLDSQVELTATFCHEKCDRGPVVRIDGQEYERCSFEDVWPHVHAEVTAEKE